jgi:Zn-dependent M16 (insulinase) family peptidase
VDSGGDPLRIPDLTFEQFQAFHAQYYHPSNSRVFFYGNDDPLQRLELLDAYLREFDAVPTAASRVQYQPKLSAPRRVEVPFPISAESEPRHMLTVNWVLNHSPLPPKEAMALGILDYLLLGTSSAPLKKALIESNLGESVTGGGLSDELLQSTFSVGLKGVLPENTARVEEILHATLQRLAAEGFSAEDVQAAVNTYEFKLRKLFPKSICRGCALTFTALI